MKYVRKRTCHTIIALTLAYLFTSLTVAVDSQPLSIDLRLEKSKIVIGSAVTIIFEIHSNDTQGVWIPWFIEPGGNLEILIEDQRGKRIRHYVPHITYTRMSASSYGSLPEGHYLGTKISIEQSHFETVGTYTIFVVYYNNDDGSKAQLPSWTGSLRSKTVEVHVEAATTSR